MLRYAGMPLRRDEGPRMPCAQALQQPRRRRHNPLVCLPPAGASAGPCERPACCCRGHGLRAACGPPPAEQAACSRRRRSHRSNSGSGRRRRGLQAAGAAHRRRSSRRSCSSSAACAAARCSWCSPRATPPGGTCVAAVPTLTIRWLRCLRVQGYKRRQQLKHLRIPGFLCLDLPAPLPPLPLALAAPRTRAWWWAASWSTRAASCCAAAASSRSAACGPCPQARRRRGCAAQALSAAAVGPRLPLCQLPSCILLPAPPPIHLCPAGYLECGESSAQGAARETWEEAGARVTVDAPFAHYDIPGISQVQARGAGA